MIFVETAVRIDKESYRFGLSGKVEHPRCTQGGWIIMLEEACIVNPASYQILGRKESKGAIADKTIEPVRLERIYNQACWEKRYQPWAMKIKQNHTSEEGMPNLPR